MKLVRCRDHGFDCEFEAKGKTEEEVLPQAAEHVHVVHGVDVTPELAEQVRASIHDVPEKVRATQ
jgi:predicted small metal-binding protein